MSKVRTNSLLVNHFLNPKYWPTWTAFLIMWAVAYFPFCVQIKIGKILGVTAFYVAKSRRKICQRNIQLCFPNLSADKQKTLVYQTFKSNGIGLVEVAISWFRNPRDYREKISISGLENLEKSVNEGHGVLLLCAHFSTLELGGTLLSLFHSLDVTYRKHTNPVFQYVMTKARNRHFSSVIEREDVRGAVNSLKKGRTLWFAPDQDYGAKHSIFVPFFGVKAATLTATSRFAKMGGAKVLFFSHYRKDDNSGYQLTISPALSNFPSTDLRKDAIRINKLIEDAVMKHPDQYIWLHKRFKTQPIGNPSVYQ